MITDCLRAETEDLHSHTELLLMQLDRFLMHSNGAFSCAIVESS